MAVNRREIGQLCSSLHALGRGGTSSLQLLILVALARLATATASNVKEANGAGSNGTVAATNQTCTEVCTEMIGFLQDLKQATEGKDLDSAQQCRARQVGFETFRCVLSHPATCLSAHQTFDQAHVSCLRIGIDTTEAPIRSNYTMSTCKMCSLSKGGTQVKVTFGESLSACEAECNADMFCATFDFDASRFACRIWHSCGMSARTGRYGCQWTVYDKPGFEAPTWPPRTGLRNGATAPAPSTTSTTAFCIAGDCKYRDIGIMSASTRPLPRGCLTLTALASLFTVMHVARMTS